MLKFFLPKSVSVLLFIAFSFFSFLASAQVQVEKADMLDSYNLTWNIPGPGSAESVPLGNGDIGLNVWFDTNGDLNFYISKTDTWSEDNYGSWGLLKLGKIRITLNPRPAVSPFQQILKLRTGEITASIANTTFKIWVDANNPVIRVEIASDQPRTMTATLENWRTASEHGISPDVILSGQTNQVEWYHRNSANANKNLANLTFGAIMKSEGLVNSGNKQLVSVAPKNNYTLSVYPHTARTNSSGEWISQIQESVTRIEALNFNETKAAHDDWWAQFWNRSWVFVSGDNTAQKTTEGYLLQRFVTACGGRGGYPIKFNGSIFVVDDPALPSGNSTINVNADYRTWGGQYWFQNTRAMYWPRLAAGDFDIMMPLFDMYYNMLEDNAALVKQYYGHNGAYFAETAPFWGGFKYAGPEVPEDWTLHYFTPILELSMMMLDYYEYTKDDDFAIKKMLPVIEAGITFYDEHFGRDANGKMLLDPVNSIEMYWKVKNPAPDIAGLKAVLTKLIALPDNIADSEKKGKWTGLLAEVPGLPMETSGAYSALLPYEGPQTATSHNGENPELYAVYPYRLYGMGKPEMLTAINTFNARKCNFKGCWSQDPVQAAMLGLSTVAKSYVSFNLSRKDPRLKFPAFWEKANDYAPDQDNGGNGENGLQQMIMYADGDKIILMPAWPGEWNCDFKLNAPKQTTIQGTITNGEITNLVVTPAERAKDVEIIKKLSYLPIDRSGWRGSASNNNSIVYRAFDDNESSRWDTQGSQQPGQWFSVNFGKKEKISRIVMEYENSSNDGPAKYEMYLSNDGINWYGPALAGTGANLLTEIEFPSTNVQYVKFNQTGSKAQYWSIHEMDAFTDTSAVDVTSVTLDSEKLALRADSVKQLTATILPAKADNQTIFWVSDNSSVAKVSGKGVVTGVKAGTTKIWAVTMDGLIKAAADVTVTGTTSSLKTGAGSETFSFNLYPNPASNVIHIKLQNPKAGIVVLNISDVSGRTVLGMEKKLNEGSRLFDVNVGHLTPGYYNVHIYSSGYSATQKLLVKSN